MLRTLRRTERRTFLRRVSVRMMYIYILGAEMFVCVLWLLLNACNIVLELTTWTLTHIRQPGPQDTLFGVQIELPVIVVLLLKSLRG